MKAIKFNLGLFLALFLLVSNTVKATTNLFFEGARPLAMGGAFSAVADDENAKWWNPAGMVYLRGAQFDLRVMPQVSKESVTLYQDLPMEDILKVQDKVSDGEDILAIPETEKILDYFADLDEIISLQAALTSGLTIPHIGAKDNWALGIGGYARADIEKLYVQQNGLTSENIPSWVKLTAYQLIYDVRVDAVANVSLAYSFFDLASSPENSQGAAVGVNIKRLTRFRFTDVSDPKTVEDLLNKNIEVPKAVSDIPHASTLAFDVGTMYKPTDWITFSVVAQDIGATLVYSDEKTPMERVPTNVKVGGAFSPVKYFGAGPLSVEGRAPLNDYDILLAGEVDDIGGNVRPDRPYLADKVHAGLEMRYNFGRDFLGIALRGGSNQGFPSYGVGLDLFWILSVDYAYYGNEKDDYHVGEIGFTF